MAVEQAVAPSAASSRLDPVTLEIIHGAIESAMRAHEHPSLNHRLDVSGRVLEEDCRALMQSFFAERRSKSASGEQVK